MTEAARISKFNRWLVWLFAAVGVLGVLAFVALVAMMLSFTLYRERSDASAPVTAKSEAAPLTVQGIDEVRGTDFLWIQIGFGREGGSSYSARSADQRNLLLLNKSTGESRRLLPGNDRSIDQSWSFAAEAGDGAQGDGQSGSKLPVAYYALAVRQAKGDALDLLIGEVATGRQAFVLNTIDGIDRIWMLSPTRIAVLLREKMQLQYRVIDVPTLKVVTAKPVDIG